MGAAGDDGDHDEHRRPDRAVVDAAVVVVVVGVVEACDDGDGEVESPAARWVATAAPRRDVEEPRWGCCSCDRKRRWDPLPTPRSCRRKRRRKKRQFDGTCGASGTTGNRRRRRRK